MGKKDRRTIGLFGTYWIRNFGDDLMGLIYAKHFQAAGFDVCTYGLEGYRGAFGIEPVANVSDLVARSDYMVVGGGGFMVPRRVTATRYHTEMDQASSDLARLCRERGVPLFALSIGGAGPSTQPEDLPDGWRKLLGAMEAITVRNEGDLQLARRFCKDVAHYADLVWLTPEIAQAGGRDRFERPTVILHVPEVEVGNLRDLVRWCRYSVPWKLWERKLRNAHPDVAFKSVASHVPLSRVGGLMKSMLDLLEQLRACVAVVSPALHLGVAAMSFGNGFVSYRGPAKTRLLLSELGLSTFCGNSMEPLHELLGDFGTLRSKAALAASKRQALQASARGHIDHFLTRIGAPASQPASAVPPPNVARPA